MMRRTKFYYELDNAIKAFNEITKGLIVTHWEILETPNGMQVCIVFTVEDQTSM